jgi:hypothetical protein
MASIIRTQYPYWMNLERSPTPYGNIPPSLTDYYKRCNPYSCKPVYPAKNCASGVDSSLPCVPFGYQPKRENPGDKIFYQYQYPFQTQFGKPYSNKGPGWAYYERTGRMPGSQ